MRTKIPNIDLGKNQITEKIRVSTAAIYRDELYSPYWLVETWIFSSDKRQPSRQVIHGTPSACGGVLNNEISDLAKKVHNQIVANLREKHGGWRAVFYRRMWE